MPANPSVPSLLAIETATEFCSVAVHCARVTFHEYAHAGQQHSEMLLPMVERVLTQAGIALSDLDAIAFSAGPGSFTGLRIACGVAQGLAFAQGLPLLPVASLDALALVAQEGMTLPERQEQQVLCAVDARMGEVYAAHLKISPQGQVTCVQSAQVLKPEALLAHYDALHFDALVGNAWERFSALTAWGRVSASHIHADAQPDARQILQLGLQQWAQGQAVAADLAHPLYVRNRIALTTAERQAGARL